jgi:hypothetical protein
VRGENRQHDFEAGRKYSRDRPEMGTFWKRLARAAAPRSTVDQLMQYRKGHRAMREDD